MTFYFKADKRVDFRELTKENFRIFKVSEPFSVPHLLLLSDVISLDDDVGGVRGVTSGR